MLPIKVLATFLICGDAKRSKKRANSGMLFFDCLAQLRHRVTRAPIERVPPTAAVL